MEFYFKKFNSFNKIIGFYLLIKVYLIFLFTCLNVMYDNWRFLLLYHFIFIYMIVYLNQ
jgi:hypothetical protein